MRAKQWYAATLEFQMFPAAFLMPHSEQTVGFGKYKNQVTFVLRDFH